MVHGYLSCELLANLGHQLLYREGKIRLGNAYGWLGNGHIQSPGRSFAVPGKKRDKPGRRKIYGECQGRSCQHGTVNRADLFPFQRHTQHWPHAEDALSIDNEDWSMPQPLVQDQQEGASRKEKTGCCERWQLPSSEKEKG